MALIDTGLGWYADENWLKQSYGLMTEISISGAGVSTEFANTTSRPSVAQITSIGSAEFSVQRGLHQGATLYEMMYDEGTYLAWYPNHRVYLRKTPVTGGVWYYYSDSGSVGYATPSWRFSEQYNCYYIDVYMLSEFPEYTILWGDQFNSLDEMLMAFVGDEHKFYKQSSGYAVSFTAKVNAYTVSSVVPHTRYLVGLISTSQAYANIVASIESGVPIQDVNYDAAYQSLIFKMSFCSFDDENGAYTVSTPGSHYIDLSDEISIFDYDPDSSYLDIFNRIRALSSIGVGEISSDDPYSGGGTSGPAVGDATFDFNSTDVDFPGVPSIGAFATGFTSMYNPTASELKDLADYMWAGAFDPENFRKLFADPMDAIIGLGIVPLTREQITGTPSELVVGNISTGISMKAVTVQYVKVNMGTILVPPKWGAYLDYAPYTKLQLFLPYIGFVDIAPDDVMDGSISVEYTVDLLSGSCIALVKTKGHVLYSFGANCSCACPVTSGQYKNGWIGAAEIGGALVSSATMLIPGMKALGAAKTAAGKVGIARDALGPLGDVASTVQDMIKPSISRSGSIGSSVGLMGIQIPYLVLTVPRMCTPGDQNVYMGYPSFITKQMSDLVGYTEIQVTHLNGMSCTDVEANEIISLLERGVIF